MDMKKLTEWFSGFRTGENLPKKSYLFLLLTAGILLLVLSFPDFSGESPSSETDAGQPGGLSENDILQEYTRNLEKQTAEMLSQVQGVGEVSVMITLKSGNRKIIEKDESEASQSTQEGEGGDAQRVSEDVTREEASVYLQNEDGSSEPYVSSELYPEIEGVAVIAGGADNAVVRRDITEAVQALFGVEAHKIKIMKRA